MGSQGSKASYPQLESLNGDFERCIRLANNLPDDLFIPVRIAAVLERPRVSGPEEVAHTWDPTAHSHNVYILPNDPHVVHRNPVAQSTDCARGHTGVSSGIHAWMIQWNKKEYGSHAVVGVATIDCPLQHQGYSNLIGSNEESWGWDLLSQRAIHNVSQAGQVNNSPQFPWRQERDNQFPWRQERDNQFQNLRRLASQSCQAGAIASSRILDNQTQKSSTTREEENEANAFSPTRVVNAPYPRWNILSNKQCQESAGIMYMILDMMEGTLSFVVDGCYLGVAHRGLQGYTLYPVVNCVWGNCEIHLTYLNGLDPEPPSLMQLSHHAILQQITKAICTQAAAAANISARPSTSSSHQNSQQPNSSTMSTRDSNDNMSPEIDVRSERNQRISRLPLPKCFRDELLQNWY